LTILISIKHGGSTDLENLANSCFPYNNNKGSDVGTVLLPDRNFTRLFDPRKDTWQEHFEMVDGVICPKTKVGEATIKVLKMNEIDRIIERREIFEIE
jgi:hypothetical protein